MPISTAVALVGASVLGAAAANKQAKAAKESGQRQAEATRKAAEQQARQAQASAQAAAVAQRAEASRAQVAANARLVTEQGQEEVGTATVDPVAGADTPGARRIRRVQFSGGGAVGSSGSIRI